MGGYIGDLSEDFDIVQTDEHLNESHHDVYNHLGATALVVFPQPSGNLLKSIFGLIEFQEIKN